MRARILAPFAVAAMLCAFASAAQAANPYPGITYQSSFGSEGSGAGQLKSPTGIAINYDTGDLYIADTDNNRVAQFDADGNFIRTWGKGVNVTSGGDLCPRAGNPGDVCGAGTASGEAGGFSSPVGIAVDNSGTAHEGAVYVQDNDNLRIERFSAAGEFQLMWGKGVNLTSPGDLCPSPGNPGDACEPGTATSELSGFSEWIGDKQFARRVSVDGAGNVYVGSGRNSGGDPITSGDARVVKFDSSGAVLGQVHDQPPDIFSGIAFPTVNDVAADASGAVYVTASIFGFGASIDKLAPSDFSASGRLDGAVETFPHQGVNPALIAIDPSNRFVFAPDGLRKRNPCITSSDDEIHLLEYTPEGELVDCTVSAQLGLAAGDSIRAVAISPEHKLYMVSVTKLPTSQHVNSEIRVYATPTATAPGLSGETASQVTSSAAKISAQVRGNMADTTVHVEYGAAGPCSGGGCDSSATVDAGASRAAAPQSIPLSGLAPDTTYHYRVIADNGVGSPAVGPDLTFHTYPVPVFDPSCPNNLARQQTGAAFLDDCRAYELVSAQDTGGYDVASDLVAGQQPYGGYPDAAGKALYAIQGGGVPGVSGKPTNRGPDPYLASRDAANQRWNTSYVGIPADAPSSEPFSSTLAGADAALSSFAFAGPEICSPCFAGGSAGIPLRTPDGNLIQGMAGSLAVSDPTPAGQVAKPLSPDGSHFLFGSTQKFEPQGNDSGTDVTLYSRDLGSNSTEVVSTDPSGATIADAEKLAELDVSANGQRVIFGDRLFTDSAGNPYYHLYMHIAGQADSIDLTPGAIQGALYAGMTPDGTQAFFTSRDNLADDTDSSADLFRASVAAGAATVERVSTGAGAGQGDTCDPTANSYNPSDWNAIPGGPTDCSVLALGGGGGITADGGAYFLSPERLDGSGTDGAPNLFFAAPGAAPVRVATLESSADKALPAPIHAYTGRFGDFDNGEGVAIDGADGSTYVYDPSRQPGSPDFVAGVLPVPGAVVKKYDAAGNLDADFGDHGVLDGSNSPGGSLGSLGDPTGSKFSFGIPTEIAIDNSTGASAGSLYVSDLSDGGIKKFDAAGNYVSEITGVGVPSTGTHVSALAVSPANGNLYALRKLPSGAVRVRVFDPTGTEVKPNTNPVGTTDAYGLAVGTDNRLYIADGAAVRIYNATTIASIGTLYSGAAKGVAVDPADNHVYVDTGTQVIEFNGAGAQVGAAFGSEQIGDSIGLAANSGRLVVSSRASRDVASFGPRKVQPDPAYDNPLVIDSAKEPATRRSADLQVSADGAYAAFPSTLALTGADSAGHYEVFRYATAGNQTTCVSCDTTLAQPTTEASLPADGLGIANDGRVFFDTGEALVARDRNAHRDAYEWQGGHPELISSGQSGADSSLLSISADATDAFFFTRETLAAQDQSGDHVKLYDARAGGGFFAVPPPAACASSNECHGPGSLAPAATPLGTLKGSGGNVPAQPKPCAKGKVLRHGKCVRKKKHHKKRHHRPHRKSKHRRGGKGR